ncbi:MAG: hypothetical protein AAGD14_01670 [Planctomycetota bacterium]
MVEPVITPEGPVVRARFGGILDGRVDTPETLQEAARRLGDVGVATVDLDIDGGRFTLMLEEDWVAGERMTDEAMQAFVAELQRFIDTTADPVSVESTLSCVQIYGNAVLETLFQTRGGQLSVFGRARPIEEDDAAFEQRTELQREIARVDKRKAIGIVALLMIGFGLMAWHSGYVDRLMAASASSLTLDAGPFEGMLSMSVEKKWGLYHVTLAPAAAFPEEGAEIPAGSDRARRAAWRIAESGGTLYVQLRSASGEVLESVEGELRVLVAGGEDRAVVVRLPGRIEGARVRLDLDRGKPAR